MGYIFEVHMSRDEPTTIEGSLMSSHGPNGFYTGPEFGLELIMDAWWQDVGDTSKLDAATAAEFQELWEWFLGKHIWVDDKGFLLDQDTKEPLTEKVKARDRHKDEIGNSSGFTDGHHYLQLKPRSDDFEARTRDIIKHFEVTTEDGEYGEFTIEVHDPRYLTHLEDNAWFHTAFTGHLPGRW